MSSTVPSPNSSLARSLYTPDLESPVEAFVEQVVKFSQPRGSQVSQFEYAASLNSDAESYEEISLSLQSTPETTRKQIILNTNPEVDFNEDPIKPRHKRVKSHPADMMHIQTSQLATLSTLSTRKRGTLGFSEILAAINAGSNCSTIVKPIRYLDSLECDASTFILHQTPKVARIISFESINSEDESSGKFINLSEQTRSHNSKQSSTSPQNSDLIRLHEPLGLTACTAMCYNCDQLVATSVEFYEGSPVPTSLLEFLEKVIGCCSSPIWLNKYKVHKCTLCKNVIS
jgi:hypothetical protein